MSDGLAMNPISIRVLHLLPLLRLLCLSLGHPYPLDPLTPSEISAIRSIIKSSPLGSSINSNTGIHNVGLEEPDKATFLSWKTKPAAHPILPRQAFVILRAGGQTHELFIDIANNCIASQYVRLGHGYPLLPFNYTPFVESVQRRGVDLSDVIGTTFTIGWCGKKANLYMRPVEGITMLADLEAIEIVEYKDHFIVPVPAASGLDFRASRQMPPYGPRGRLYNQWQHSQVIKPAPSLVLQTEQNNQRSIPSVGTWQLKLAA